MIEAEVVHHGWRLQVAMDGAEGHGFHAIYRGEDFGRPRRVLTLVAWGTHDAAGAALAAHGLAEGYFLAAETLSPLRAAGVGAAAINRWLWDQGQQTGRSMAARLAAIGFSGGAAVLLQAGDCGLWRLRGGGIIPLAAGFTPLGAGEQGGAVGSAPELALQGSEDLPEPGDRYLLATHTLPPRAGDALSLAALAAACALRGGSAVAVRVAAVPAPEADAILTRLAGLPLRAPPAEGALFDGYRIGAVIARGPVSVLHRAEVAATGATVALKIPLPGMAKDPVLRAGFLREAWIGSKIDSPWVARYLPPAAAQSALYLVMPFYPGETLERRLSRAPPIDLEAGLAIAELLCAAVAALERLQVIHRDIKPDNVLLPEGGGLRLLDLGIAYLPGVDPAGAAALGGTPRYMAPELFRGALACQRTEVYALGITLYRMWSGGAFPFGQNERVPLRRRRPDLPLWLGQVIARAIEPRPPHRLADVHALQAALRAGLGGAKGWERAVRPPWITSLRGWQAAALGFALISLVLLGLLLRRR